MRVEAPYSPFESFRANGISLTVTSKYPFMLSLIEACSQFFNSLLRCNNATGSRKNNRYLTMSFASRPDGDLNVAERN